MSADQNPDLRQPASRGDDGDRHETVDVTTLGSYVVFDEEEPRVVLRSPVDCSSVAPRTAGK